MDRALRRDLEAAADALPPGTTYLDRLGCAIYQVEPSWATVIACLNCRLILLVPTLPRSLRFRHPCSGCGTWIPLEPPLEVIGARPV